MKRVFVGLWCATLLVGGAAVWRMQPDGDPRRQPASAVVTPAEIDIVVSEPIQPLPRTVAVDPEEVALGKRLFHEPNLSSDGNVACASCHDLAKGGTDGRARSKGMDGAEGAINAPTVFNSTFNFKQFWDGRADTLEEQVEGPILNGNEMASDWSAILARLGDDPSYVAAFAEAYPDGLTRKNVKRAIASFERSLITPDSRFDRYLRGDAAAITDEEKQGYLLFKDLGCTSCHQGINVGGNMFQTMGRMGNYFVDRGEVTSADFGRFNVTGKERDRFKFKVPGLRNVALTAPYLHDGQAETLDAAVRIMAKYQLGHELDDQDTQLLVAFLLTLTGEYRGGK